MTKCSEIPKSHRNNLPCQLDIGSLKSNGCINWNQYYEICATSDQNPFSGSISFDNIGLAMVVVFQVSFSDSTLIKVT